jgi:hypothetical protein
MPTGLRVCPGIQGGLVQNRSPPQFGRWAIDARTETVLMALSAQKWCDYYLVKNSCWPKRCRKVPILGVKKALVLPIVTGMESAIIEVRVLAALRFSSV